MADAIEKVSEGRGVGLARWRWGKQLTAWLRAYLRIHTGEPIAIAVGLGLALLGGAFWAYAARCWGNPSGECEAMRHSPPWTLLTALAAGPAALLTWYWRTQHKKDDIDHGRSQELTSRFANAVELLEKGAVGAVYALERIAHDSPRDHWAVMSTLAAHIRQTSADMKDQPSGREVFVRIQAAIVVLGRRNRSYDPEGGWIDLRGATLDGIAFSTLDFSGAWLVEASLVGADLRETDFTGARFDNVNAAGAIFDDSTKLDDMGHASLTMGHARDRTSAYFEAAQRDIDLAKQRGTYVDVTGSVEDPSKERET